MKIFICTLVSLLPVIFSYSQAQFNGWLASFNNIALKNNFSIQSDIQLRSSNQVEHVQTFLARAGLNYNVSKNVMFSVGYAYIQNRRAVQGVAGYMPEHRIWQQLLITHKLAKFIPLSHRFRLEQRFIGNPVVENNELKKDGHVFASRTRYFLRGIIPLKGQRSFSKGVFAAVQNEIFLNIGNTTTVNGKTFDQNRLYAAVGYRFSKKLDMEAGYMNQYISGRDEAFTNNHIVQIAGYLRLP